MQILDQILNLCQRAFWILIQGPPPPEYQIRWGLWNPYFFETLWGCFFCREGSFVLCYIQLKLVFFSIYLCCFDCFIYFSSVWSVANVLCIKLYRPKVTRGRCICMVRFTGQVRQVQMPTNAIPPIFFKTLRENLGFFWVAYTNFCGLELWWNTNFLPTFCFVPPIFLPKCSSFVQNDFWLKILPYPPNSFPNGTIRGVCQGRGETMPPWGGDFVLGVYAAV